MLKAGGNAVDAAIAASFAISVLRPQSTGLGGGGFLILRDDKTKQNHAFDFREKAPQKASRNMFLDRKGQPSQFKYRGRSVGDSSTVGHLSVGVPGLVRGLIEVQKNYGKLPLAEVMKPAISYARQGFTIGPDLADAIAGQREKLATFEGSRAIFLDKKLQPRKKGSKLVQIDLANTLESIAQTNGKSFYEGKIADLIVQEIQNGKGIISAEDLRNYKPMKREPIIGTYRDHIIVAMPPPSSGGVHIVQLLNILELYDLKKLHQTPDKYYHTLIEAMRLAYADRSLHLGDSDFVKIPIKGLISKSYASHLKSKIPKGKAGNSEKVLPGNPTPYESPSTTHISVVDQNGLAVSTTQTINLSFGSGVVARGTGVVLNNEMDDFSKKPGVPNAFGLVGSAANSIEPEKRMLSSMSPTIILNSKGQTRLVVGSPGGSRIITATLQTILNFLDHNLGPSSAVHLTRIHHQWKPDLVFYEKEAKGETIKNLEGMGYKTKESSWYVGNVQAVFKQNGKWVAVSDTRAEGQPRAY